MMCRAPKPKTSNKTKRVPGWKGASRMPTSPLSRLKAGMDVYQFTAADEILTAFRMANGLPVARDPDLDIPTACPRFDDADAFAAKQSDLVRVYFQWRHDLANTQALAVVDAVMFAEMPLSDLDAARRERKGSARAQLAIGLKHFSALRGNVPAGVRDWKYKR